MAKTEHARKTQATASVEAADNMKERSRPGIEGTVLDGFYDALDAIDCLMMMLDTNIGVDLRQTYALLRPHRDALTKFRGQFDAMYEDSEPSELKGDSDSLLSYKLSTIMAKGLETEKKAAAAVINGMFDQVQSRGGGER